ncbi:MAG: pentapeptide repeat-containing protein [Parachlamydiales bacterium]|nr:pentapeptide repeat-containing protein [Parachlamydiales bacterium]
MQFVENQVLTKEDWSKRILKDFEFVDCQFVNCDFTNADFTMATFSNCTMDQCNLSYVKWTTARVMTLTIKSCKCVNNAFYEAIPKFFHLIVEDTLMMTCNFTGMSLIKSKFINCKLMDCFFQEADCKGVTFQGCDLKGSLFFHTNLEKANFKSACNYSISVADNNVKGAQFSYPEAMDLLNGLGIVIS